MENFYIALRCKKKQNPLVVLFLSYSSVSIWEAAGNYISPAIKVAIPGFVQDNFSTDWGGGKRRS